MVRRDGIEWMGSVVLNIDNGGQVGGQVRGVWWRVKCRHVGGGMIS